MYVEGHCDSTPVLTSSFVDEKQSQDYILFKKSQGRPPRWSQ